jgi:LysM repeat protein
VVKPYFTKKAKKLLFLKLSMSLASFAILGSPLLAQAGVLSIFSSLFDKTATITNAQTTHFNSQTMPLLAPAVNIDPNPAKGGGDITVVGGAALSPIDGPSGTLVDISDEPPSQSSQISVYTVRNGDTLSDIAHMFGVTTNTIIWANDIQNRTIHPGDMLIILPVTGIRYTVAKGDTIASIAKKYKGDAAEIASYNEISDASLAVGTSILIPNGESTTASSVSAGSGVKSPKVKSSGTTAKLHDAGGPDYGSYYVWPMVGGVLTQGLHGYNGVDIGAPKNTPIIAAAEGTVIIAKDNGGWNGGYGNYLVIQHPNGTQTLYAHATSLVVSVGDQIAQGQTVALVGRTGQATGYHLHFEVRGAKNPFGK